MRRHLVETGRFAWPLLQGTAAATAAWVIARYVLDHPEPFFAPVAAVIALNASLGERGRNALRLLQGVIVGIIVGELVLVLIGQGWAALGLAIFIATAIARGTGGARIVIAQAAVGAILIVAIGDAEAGPDRLIDAFVGAAVALVFSQLLFTPEPVALVRRAEAAALREIGDGLDLTARAMEEGDDATGERALDKLRALRDELAELARTRAAGQRIVRRSAVWRSQRTPVVREVENAGHLDLLGGSCLMLARVCLISDGDAQAALLPHVRDLAGSIHELARDPGERSTRQLAADRALAVARDCAQPEAARALNPPGMIMVDIVATDLMIFAGTDPGQAAAAVEEGTGELEVPTPPLAPRLPFRRNG